MGGLIARTSFINDEVSLKRMHPLRLNLPVVHRDGRCGQGRAARVLLGRRLRGLKGRAAFTSLSDAKWSFCPRPFDVPTSLTGTLTLVVKTTARILFRAVQRYEKK